jgi:hypothetical protein
MNRVGQVWHCHGTTVLVLASVQANGSLYSKDLFTHKILYLGVNHVSLLGQTSNWMEYNDPGWHQLEGWTCLVDINVP